MRRKKLELTHPDYPGAVGKFDRRGALAWQYGRGGAAHYLPGEPGDPKFHERYLQLAEVQSSRQHHLDNLADAYLRSTGLSDAICYPPRGLSRYEAARYIGISPTVFDELVAEGKMPRCKHSQGQKIWDRVQLDIAFDALDSDEDSPINKALREARRQTEK
ncbi:hypothetical protein B5K05_17385 [Rhizobium phaseoli]|uniref:hypothetical protein n=1 Tax=Rhizobium phaseoli TaxID=396 RepID=UPI00036A2F12|nr:hypothetical protein RPHASCH2410_CH18380 [Rhizobium phaseoli Ch24-10]RDJ07384.1 hypothetical protein B5K04_17350 [Rhizobium phaseoli]RDJ11075.1 hypothetical protein B5K05_17385 [Rhizobium phaseoli]